MSKLRRFWKKAMPEVGYAIAYQWKITKGDARSGLRHRYALKAIILRLFQLRAILRQ